MRVLIFLDNILKECEKFDAESLKYALRRVETIRSYGFRYPVDERTTSEWHDFSHASLDGLTKDHESDVKIFVRVYRQAVGKASLALRTAHDVLSAKGDREEARRYYCAARNYAFAGDSCVEHAERLANEPKRRATDLILHFPIESLMMAEDSLLFDRTEKPPLVSKKFPKAMIMLRVKMDDFQQVLTDESTESLARLGVTSVRTNENLRRKAASRTPCGVTRVVITNGKSLLKIQGKTGEDFVVLDPATNKIYQDDWKL